MRQPFGQNFLTDTSFARRIVAAAELTPDDTVIEIGPGRGVLTDVIAPAVRHLAAVEIDRDLADPLRRRFASSPHVEVVTTDFLRLDETTLLAPGEIPVYIANLPYNVATAIIEKILTGNRWRRAVFMVQKEVAQRIAAPHNTAAYGAYSVFCQYYASVEHLFAVPPGAFMPPPQVDSAVIRLTPTQAPPPDAHFLALTRACFQHKRKTIANSLEHATTLAKGDIIHRLEAAGVTPTARAQQLPRETFTVLTKVFQRDTIVSHGTKNK